MLNGWRIKHAETVDRRRSVTGATIAPGWTLPTGIVDRTIASAATTATRATTVFRAAAAIDVTIPTNEIIATIAAEERDNQATSLRSGCLLQIARRWHWLCRCHSDRSPRLGGGGPGRLPYVWRFGSNMREGGVYLARRLM